MTNSSVCLRGPDGRGRARWPMERFIGTCRTWKYPLDARFRSLPASGSLPVPFSPKSRLSPSWVPLATEVGSGGNLGAIVARLALVGEACLAPTIFSKTPPHIHPVPFSAPENGTVPLSRALGNGGRRWWGRGPRRSGVRQNATTKGRFETCPYQFHDGVAWPRFPVPARIFVAGRENRTVPLSV